MGLFSHLFVSHSIPLLMTAIALAITLAALIRISFVLTTLSDTQLSNLDYEDELHRAGWDLDVSMRHGQARCVEGQPSEQVAQQIRPKLTALRTLLQRGELIRRPAPRAMRDIAEGYLATAEEIVAGDSCAGLLGAKLRDRRNDLDEQFTDAWVERLRELHDVVIEKDREASNVAAAAIWTGIPLAAISFLLAMFIARRMARMINRPLASLARMATRVGQGDLSMSVHVDGPAEIVALAKELESMRSQLEQLESLKQGFLASVSHELRTPLSKIREALSLMEDGAAGELTTKQARLVQIARIACEREIRMVTTLLDLSRLRAGGPLRLREGVSIDAVVQMAVDDERGDATSRQIAIEVTCDHTAIVDVFDPVLLERAIANLVRNACSVSQSGQRVLVQRKPAMERPAHTGSWIAITVVDNGPGVPREIREKVFDAFVTQAVPQTGKVGIGLGLALAREVAQAHGGDLEVADSGPHGSTFCMWLPIQRFKQATAETSHDEEASEPGPRTAMS